VIEELETKMKSSGFTYLNLFTSEPKNYDKALLSDVMHMSEYGWLQVDEFIVHRYSLCK
jgi:poly-D-alanine transfer protein DltD